MILRKKSFFGQASLEYLALAVFVMMGIIISGPYVVRSINAHFKSIEEGALDSDREDIQEGTSNDHLPECDCPASSGCSDGSPVHGVACPKTHRRVGLTCSPDGCAAELIRSGMMDADEKCQNDITNTCCTDETPGLCGTDAGSHGKCSAGFREYIQLCGSPNSIININCRADDTCDYRCQQLGANASWCNVALNSPLTSPSVPVTYRNHGACTMTTPCEAQCDEGYTTLGPGGCIPAGRCGDGVCEPAKGECGSCPDCQTGAYYGNQWSGSASSGCTASSPPFSTGCPGAVGIRNYVVYDQDWSSGSCVTVTAHTLDVHYCILPPCYQPTDTCWDDPSDYGDSRIISGDAVCEVYLDGALTWLPRWNIVPAGSNCASPPGSGVPVGQSYPKEILLGSFVNNPCP